MKLPTPLLFHSLFALLLLLHTPTSAELSNTSMADIPQIPSPSAPLTEPSPLSSPSPSIATTYPFNAEVSRLLGIIINSLYLQRDVFIRELVSNAADANEKFRYLSLTNAELVGTLGVPANDLSITLSTSKEDNTITVTDTGIGMTQQDLINNLGTIANSGTSNFQEALAAASTNQAGSYGGDVSLIGQFGVGFYSAFLVADRVCVYSKHPDDDQYVWESTADASFSIRKDERGNTLGRGTSIVLHLKPDAEEFLDVEALSTLVEKYSQYVNFPIYIRKEVERDEEVEEEGAEEGSEKKDAEVSSNDVDISDDKEEEDGESGVKKGGRGKKVVKVKDFEMTLINKNKPLWLRSKDSISESEYKDFYKSISTADSLDYFGMVHFAAEGEFDFKALLYIPSEPPVDFYETHVRKRRAVKLYARRVLVSDEFEDLLPRYLSWVRGVVDSEDLPLNVAREQLQDQRIIKLISKKIVKKMLELMHNLHDEGLRQRAAWKEELHELQQQQDTKSEEIIELKKKMAEGTKYDKFYKKYNNYLRLGCNDSDEDRMKLVRLLEYDSSTKALAGEDSRIGLDEYMRSLSEDDKDILYASADNVKTALKLPQMQKFNKNLKDVLILTSNMDEYCFQRLHNYKDKQFKSIQKDGSSVTSDEEKRRLKLLTKYYEPLTKFMTDTLSPKVGRVIVSSSLSKTPCMVVSSSFGYSASVEKMLKVQAFGNVDMLKMMSANKVLEINPDHPLIRELLRIVKELPAAEEGSADSKEKQDVHTPQDATHNRAWLSNRVKLLWMNAMLESGFDIEEGGILAAETWNLMQKDVGLNPSDEVQPLDADSLGIKEEGKEDEDDVFSGLDYDPSDVSSTLRPILAERGGGLDMMEGDVGGEGDGPSYADEL